MGLALLAGKCLARRLWPAAESVPLGAFRVPPKPAGLYAVTAKASTPKTTTPVISAAAGRRTTRWAIRPQIPAVPVPRRVWVGQNAARPKMASNAGSRVSPASSIMPMPMASGIASWE